MPSFGPPLWHAGKMFVLLQSWPCSLCQQRTDLGIEKMLRFSMKHVQPIFHFAPLPSVWPFSQVLFIDVHQTLPRYMEEPDYFSVNGFVHFSLWNYWLHNHRGLWCDWQNCYHILKINVGIIYLEFVRSIQLFPGLFSLCTGSKHSSITFSGVFDALPLKTFSSFEQFWNIFCNSLQRKEHNIAIDLLSCVLFFFSVSV